MTPNDKPNILKYILKAYLIVNTWLDVNGLRKLWILQNIFEMLFYWISIFSTKWTGIFKFIGSFLLKQAKYSNSLKIMLSSKRDSFYYVIYYFESSINLYTKLHIDKISKNVSN